MNSESAEPSAQHDQNQSGNECPFHYNQFANKPNADKIPCPALLTLYNQGWLGSEDCPINEDGTVNTRQLEKALAHIGLEPTIVQLLVKGADNAVVESDNDTADTSNIKGLKNDDKFNLFNLRDTNLNHAGSTGIRDPNVNSEKLEKTLLRFSEVFSEDNKEERRMYAEHFAAAANSGLEQDPGDNRLDSLKGTLKQTFEFQALLEVFGRLDKNNQRYLTEQDINNLWIDGRFPEGWKVRKHRDSESNPEDGEITVAKIVAKASEMAILRILDRAKS